MICKKQFVSFKKVINDEHTIFPRSFTNEVMSGGGGKTRLAKLVLQAALLFKSHVASVKKNLTCGAKE